MYSAKLVSTDDSQTFKIIETDLQEIEMRKKMPYWRNEHIWMCPRHLPASRIPRNVQHCWFTTCDSVRPPLLKFVETEQKKLEQTEKCAWKDCNKGEGKEAAVKRDTSKYCSLDCKNKNARWRYKLRQKGLLPKVA